MARARERREAPTQIHPPICSAPQEARQILRAVPVDRIAFEATSQAQASGRAYRYRFASTIGGLFEGTIGARALASPTGSGVSYQPVFQGIWRSDRRAA